MQRGYARDAKDEQRLIAAGLKPSRIYREDRGCEQWGRWIMRSGETLAVVDGLRVFGLDRKSMVEAVKLVHSWGATIVDAESGLRSDKDGAEMLHCALTKIRADAVAPTPARAAEMQRASVRARTNGRMPIRQAAIIWRDAALTVPEALEQMPGWSQGAAYRQLGKRQLPPGPRSQQ